MPLYGHAQCPGEGLEDRFGLVVVVLAPGRDLQVAARGAAQPAEQLASEDNLAKLNEILDEQFGGDSNETGAQGAD